MNEVDVIYKTVGCTRLLGNDRISCVIKTLLEMFNFQC